MVVVGNASNPCSDGPQAPQAPQAARRHQQHAQQCAQQHAQQHAQQLPSSSQAFPDDLTCGICKELLQAAVTIDICGHSFCSFCIRLDFCAQSKKLKPKVCCPLCRADVFRRGVNKADQHLLANLELQQQAFHFKQNLVQQSREQSKSKSKEQEDDSCIHASPRRRSARRMRPLLHQQQQQQQQQQQHSEVHYRRRNPPLQKMRAVHYQGKKRKDLQALLKAYGLLTTGTEDELKHRYTRFVLYWNSVCDEQVDPPSEATVLQQFRSSELKKATARASTTLLTNHNSNHNNNHNNNSNTRGASNDAEARIALLKEHAEGFRAIHQNILERYAHKWSETNACLAIAVLQSHPMIQNPNFRKFLRQRSMNGNHNIPVKALLSGEVPVPTSRMENNLLTVNGIIQEGFKRSSPSVSNTMAVKRQRIEAPATTIGATTRTKQPIVPISNPYSKKRSRHPPPTASIAARQNPYSKRSNGPPTAYATTRVATQLSPQNAYSSSNRNNNNNRSQNPTSKAEWTSPPRNHQPHNSTSNYISRSNNNGMAASTALPTIAKEVTSYHIDARRNSQRHVVSTNAAAAIAAATTTTTTTTTPPASTANRHRHAISPPTVALVVDATTNTTTTKTTTTATATPTKTSMFKRSSSSRTKKPSWEWTCMVCMYEMKVDRRATNCAFCGSAKGATLEAAFCEHNHDNRKQNNNQNQNYNNSQNNQQEAQTRRRATTTTTKSGSPNDPIEMR